MMIWFIKSGWILIREPSQFEPLAHFSDSWSALIMWMEKRTRFCNPT